MSSRAQSAGERRSTRALLCAGTLLLTALAAVDPLLTRFPDVASSVPTTLRLWATSPAHEIRAAQAALQRGEPADEWIAAAWRKAPWYSAVWLLAGIDAGRVAPAAALPFYAEALRLDPWSPSVARVAVPALLAAGWIDIETALERARRFNVGAVYAALPATPPADWPWELALQEVQVAEQLRLHHRLDWLGALAEDEAFARAEPAVRREILLALCAAREPACLPLLSACLQPTTACPGGIVADPSLLTVALDAAREAGEIEMLQRLIPVARTSARDPGLVQALVRALEAVGEKEEAARIRRLHPALRRQ